MFRENIPQFSEKQCLFLPVHDKLLYPFKIEQIDSEHLTPAKYSQQNKNNQKYGMKQCEVPFLFQQLIGIKAGGIPEQAA